MKQTYDEWLREKVAEGIADADAGNLYTWEEAINKIRQNYQDLQEEPLSA